MTHIILINLRLVFVFQRSLVRERRDGDIFIKSWVGNLFNWDFLPNVQETQKRSVGHIYLSRDCRDYC